jgi:hypothetical protein
MHNKLPPRQGLYLLLQPMNHPQMNIQFNVSCFVTSFEIYDVPKSPQLHTGYHQGLRVVVMVVHTQGSVLDHLQHEVSVNLSGNLDG